MRLKLNSFSLAICLALVPGSLAAQPAYLPADNVALQLADGKPWTADAPTGRSFKLVLDSNGSGRIRGPLGFSISTDWAVVGDEICLENRLLSKCLRFSSISGGFQGWENGEPDLRLSR